MFVSRGLLLGFALLLAVVVVDSSTVRGVRGLMVDDASNSTSTPKNRKAGMSNMMVKANGTMKSMVASNLTATTGKMLNDKGKGGRYLMGIVSKDDFIPLNYTSNKKPAKVKTSKGKMKVSRGLMDKAVDDDFFMMDASNSTTSTFGQSKGKGSDGAKGKSKGQNRELGGDDNFMMDDDFTMDDDLNYTTTATGQSKSKGSGSGKGTSKGDKRKLSDDDMHMMDDYFASSTNSPEMPMDKGKGLQKSKGKGKSYPKSKSKSRTGQEGMTGCDQFESKPRDLCKRYCSECHDDITMDDDYTEYLLDSEMTGNVTSTQGNQNKPSKGKGGKSKGDGRCSALREEFFHRTNQIAFPCFEE
jgi:hypothetical protein